MKKLIALAVLGAFAFGASPAFAAEHSQQTRMKDCNVKAKGKKGMVLEADGGTLFLDEIGDMPISSQTRLLRVLAEREVTPVGRTRPGRDRSGTRRSRRTRGW